MTTLIRDSRIAMNSDSGLHSRLSVFVAVVSLFAAISLFIAFGPSVLDADNQKVSHKDNEISTYGELPVNITSLSPIAGAPNY